MQMSYIRRKWSQIRCRVRQLLRATSKLQLNMLPTWPCATKYKLRDRLLILKTFLLLFFFVSIIFVTGNLLHFLFFRYSDTIFFLSELAVLIENALFVSFPFFLLSYPYK